MAMRMTGLISGMDTESVIQELVAVRQVKVDTAKKDQTKLEWKQDVWKELNSKIYKLYSSTLSDMRFTGDYVKRTTKVSDESVVSVITGENAMNGVQSLKVKSLAKTGYLTGKQLSVKEKYSSSTSLTASADEGGMGLAVGSSIAVKTGEGMTQIKITEGMTIGKLTEQLRKAGLNASFDEKNQRFFLSSKESGADGDFLLAGTNSDGVDALVNLGIGSYEELTRYADGSGTLLQEEIDTTVASRLADYLESKTEVESKVQEIADKVQAMGVSDVKGLSAEELRKKLEEFRNTEDYEDLTAKQKKQINEYVDDLNEHDASLKEYAKYYTVDADGKTVASDELKAEVTAELTEIYDTLKDAAVYAKDTLNKVDFEGEDAPQRVNGSNAVIYLNGAKFEGNTNTFEINGLTYTVNATTAENEEVTITTEDDTQGVYDMIKNFVKQYNELIIEMDKLYNADTAKDYEPLTDEEKESMSEDAVEKWEQKIKDSLLRKDSTLSSVSSAMKEIMAGAVTMSDGSKMYLSEFGIETLGYFDAEENERNAYHIAGDPDDTHTATDTDKLKNMIATDSAKVVEFFTGLSKNLYNKLGDLMSRTEYSSAYTVYNDKAMKEEYDDYTKEIKELESKLQDYEDKWYAKFSAMETAMAKLQSNASAVTSLLGGA